MKRIILLVIFILSITCQCFAQSNQTKSLTVTTYYPAPNAVFRNVKLTPRAQPEGNSSSMDGTIYYNSTVLKPFIHYNKTWKEIGEMPFKYNIASPATCAGTISNETWNNNSLCSVPWHQDVQFNPPFSKVPHVMVFPEELPHHLTSNCTRNTTEGYRVYPWNINETGFTIIAGSKVYESALDSDDQCNNDSKPGKYDNYWARVLVKWFAIIE